MTSFSLDFGDLDLIFILLHFVDLDFIFMPALWNLNFDRKKFYALCGGYLISAAYWQFSFMLELGELLPPNLQILAYYL